jgi:hypothetical protein
VYVSSLGGDFMDTFQQCFVTNKSMMFKLKDGDSDEPCPDEDSMFIDLARCLHDFDMS